MSEWRRIQTAPKKEAQVDRTPYGDLVHHYGPPILAYPVHGRVSVVRWWWTTGGALSGEASNFLTEGGNAAFPTHWQPIPAPPAAQEKP